ncbi:MAG: hypothetical protein JKY78_12080 [Hyphomonas sp.]|nr:hypothetical protein [Hyphomonas sp.]
MITVTLYDLIRAILAMDVYNRGYGSGMLHLSQSLGTKIGNWEVKANADDSNDSNSAFDAGFYALAYEFEGETVISYRGTDFNFNVPSLSSDIFDIYDLTAGGQATKDPEKGGSDALNGYGIALGLGEGDLDQSLGPIQADLAAKFYEAVTSVNSGSVSVTGHSLGGGLAGYIAATRGVDGVLFDNMPFGVAAAKHLGLTIQDAAYVSKLQALSAFHTEQEFLAAVRTGAIQDILGDTPIAGNILELALDIDADQLSLDTAFTEGLVGSEGFNSNASGLSHFSEYHSMAMLVSLMWTEYTQTTAWKPAGQLLWDSYFNASVAETIPGAKDWTVDGIGTLAATVQKGIAYSAIPIDQEEHPFGDTAIWSMFDDAGDLGAVLAGAEADFFSDTVRWTPGLPSLFGTKDVKQYLADLLVQYAGAVPRQHLWHRFEVVI